jgi:hypothetical protein
MGTIGITDKFGSAGTFLENITKNRNNILGGVSNTQENNNKGIKGKYIFLKDFIVSTCLKTDGSSGVVQPSCIEYKYYNYKVGDVINIQEFYFNNELTGKLPISEQNLSVPMSYLQKVDDIQLITKQNISYGKTYKDNSTQAKSIDKEGMNIPTKGKEDITKKILGAYNQNLIIAVVLVAGYFAYKKFKK